VIPARTPDGINFGSKVGFTLWLRRHYGRRLGFGRDALAEGKRLIFFLRHGRLAEPGIRRIGIKFWGHGINPLFCRQFCCAGVADFARLCRVLPS
jgi:hypothetical protein